MVTDYIDGAVMERLRSLLMAARFPVAGAFTGMHRSFLKGTAMEFAELRNYVPGDDLRRLDWKAYARSDKFFLKEYESETNARAYFLIDTSGSMQFKGHDGGVRLDYARRLVAHLALLFLSQGDSVGVACEVAGQLRAQRLRGEVSLPQVIETLRGLSAEGTGDVAAQLHELTQHIPRRSMVIVLTDGLTALDDLDDALQHLRHHAHEVSLLQLLSQRELELDEPRGLSFRDIETQEVLQTDAPSVRAHYQQELAAHQAQLRALCQRSMVRYRLLPTEDSVESALYDLILAP